MVAVTETALADGLQVVGTPQHAGRRATDLHQGVGANGLEHEHGVEGGDLVDPDDRHAEGLGHHADRGLGDPALLLLDNPEHGDDGGLLAPLGEPGDPRLHLLQALGTEGKAVGLVGG